VVTAIRAAGILDDFPNRTEADLYLWIVEHQHYLGERYGQDIPLEQAAADFSSEYSSGRGQRQLEAQARGTGDQHRVLQKRHPVVAVFGSGSAPQDHDVLAQAKRLGELLADAGFTLMTGGYGGTMEAASRGARQAAGDKARVIGVTMDLFTPPLEPNEWLTKEKRVRDFLPRLKRLTSADAFVVLRGGIGTLTEATLVWSLLQTGQLAPRPFVFVGDHWNRLFDAFRAETFMTDHDLEHAVVVDDADAAAARIQEFLVPRP
jgi:uncharacterized protein (TIGR00730 family)